MIRDRFNLTQDVHVSWQPGGSYRILANIIASFVDWTPEREAGVLTTGLAFPNIAKLTSQFAHRNNGDFPFASLQYPLDWNYQDRLLALAEHREQGKNSQVIFVDLPNNPTGDYPNIETMIRLAEATSRKDKPDLLIIDEAYADAAQITCAQLTEQFPHIIVLKGISKGIGLAGIRAGYAIVSKGELSKSYKDNMDLVFDLGGLDQLLISQALKPEIIEPHLSMIKENIISVKSHLIEQLNSLGIKIFPTKLDVPIMLVQAEGIENFAPFLARWGVIVEQGQDFIAVHDDVDNSMARIRVPKSIQIANKAFKRIQAAISEAQQNPESCWV